MTSTVRPLYDLIRHSLLCQEQLEPNKLTEKQTTEAFVRLDQRRRGYIDVADFYAKFQELKEN